jgi:hypothetical protein
MTRDSNVSLRVMKRALVVLAAAMVVAYAAFWIYASRRMSKAVSAPWPDGLGTIASVPNRFPLQSASEAAQDLIGLTDSLGIDLAPRTGRESSKNVQPYLGVAPAVGHYVKSEIETGAPGITDPPANVAAFLTANALPLAAIRQLLISADAIVWPRDIQDRNAPLPNLAGHVALTRVLAANALARAQRADAGAWDDLHAAWNLNRTLHGHPELIAQIVTLSGARTINAVARKMPAPEPAWRTQMDAVDNDRLLLRSMQFEKWLLRGRRGLLPNVMMETADVIDREREIARRLAAVTRCDFDGKAFYPRSPNLAAMWQRAFRYRAEREATRNALLLASGRAIEPRSRCTDGQWAFDGTEIRFSREIASREGMPLALRVR